MKSQADLYHDLPSVDELLRMPAIAALVAQEGPTAVADACRNVLGRLRNEIGAGHLGSRRMASNTRCKLISSRQKAFLQKLLLLPS